MYKEAVDVCRAGLAVHPAYPSARVTLGRALTELHHYDEAQHELEQVLKAAPENLAAIRGLADVLRRQGSLAEALVQYRAALAIARHDPDLEQTIAELSTTIEAEAEAEAPVPIAVASDAPPEESAPMVAPILEAPVAVADPAAEQERARAAATLAALERLLNAVHVARAQRCA